MALAVPRLPLELMHHVVAQLHGDFPTLSSCAIASKLLLDAARRQLFYRIVLTLGRETGTLCAFLLFIESTPLIARHIREIRLQAAYAVPEEIDFNLVQLGFMLAKCKSLQALELDGVSFRLHRNFEVHGVDADTIATSGWCLKSLSICSLSPFKDEQCMFAPYIYILSSFKQLDTLALRTRQLWFSQNPEALLTALPRELTLNQLMLEPESRIENNIAILSHAITYTNTTKTLRRLSVILQPGVSLAPLQDVLIPACSALKEIHVDMREFDSRMTGNLPEVPPVLQILPITSVQLVGIAGLYPTCRCLCVVPHLLEQLPRTLQAVTVDLQVWPESHRGARKHFLEMEWKLLAGQLHECTRLRRLQFDIIWHKPKLIDYGEFLPVVKDSVVHGLTPLMKSDVSFEVRQPLSRIELF